MSKNANILSVSGLSKSFSGVLALDKVNLAVEEGQTYGLIGPNGSGKTTFFNVITGLLPASDGKVHFYTKDITNLEPYIITKIGISRTFQGGRVFPTMTCLENVMCGMYCHTKPDLLGTFLRLPFTQSAQEVEGKKEALELLKLVGLSDSAERWADELVWVERQLLQIARALAAKPRLLLLDEPTSGMGAEETEKVRKLVRQIQGMGVTIILVSHDVKLIAGIADWVTVLNFGKKISEGTAEQAQNDPKVLEAYLGRE